MLLLDAEWGGDEEVEAGGKVERSEVDNLFVQCSVSGLGIKVGALVNKGSGNGWKGWLPIDCTIQISHSLRRCPIVSILIH